ncbi:hypothetical protein N7G274_001714 [Stereocaulon virgatum]|uniref:CSN8/PSMD8/EIF3K domain-containing protein n=1 Tax=Stereocaulon virgatum TaxID=373712 RepID=A0ABR4AKG5_9LECA
MSQPGAAEYRPPAGQRDRLRAVHSDPLEDIGLPSKGDDGLLDFQAQEEYYGRIFQRYEEFHLRAGSACGDALAETMGSLSLHGPTLNDLTLTKRSGIISSPETRLYPGSSNNPRERSIILMAMRKLREAVVASARKDLFAVRAYIYIIRATILEKHMESYHPALLHVLYRIHPVTALSDSEYSEFVGYYILDLACRQDNLSAAYEASIRFHYMDVKVSAVLKALVHGDWCAFWSIKDLMTTYQQGLLEWAEEGVRKRALDCLGKSYLTVEKEYLERVVRRSWEELVQGNSTQWHLNGNIITIRNMKRQ